MRTLLISYANRPFHRSQQLLHASALRFGFDQVHDYSDHWLRSTRFYKDHERILSQPRGNGYWLWKPFLILDALSKVSDGDVVAYVDSGACFTGSAKPLIELAREREWLVFCNEGHTARTWTKRDCFILMGCDNPSYHDAVQISAGQLFFRKSARMVKIVEEWLTYCMDPRIITDQENTCGQPNLPEFRDHRHDQSVISLLVAKYQIEQFRDPSQWGNHYKPPQWRTPGEFVDGGYRSEALWMSNSPYPTLMDHHRKRHRLTLKDYAMRLTSAWHYRVHGQEL